MADLPHYRSFEEDEEPQCILCKTSLDDPVEYGDKVSYENITIHHFCAVIVCYINWFSLKAIFYEVFI